MKKILIAVSIIFSSSVFAVDQKEMKQAEIKYSSLLKAGMSPEKSLNQMAKEGVKFEILEEFIILKNINIKQEKQKNEVLFNVSPSRNNSVSPS